MDPEQTPIEFLRYIYSEYSIIEAGHRAYVRLQDSAVALDDSFDVEYLSRMLKSCNFHTKMAEISLKAKYRLVQEIAEELAAPKDISMQIRIYELLKDLKLEG